MKPTVLIRRHRDGRYLAKPGQWTLDRNQAVDFGNGPAAIRFVQNRSLLGVEVLLTVQGSLADFPVLRTIAPCSARLPI